MIYDGTKTARKCARCFTIYALMKQYPIRPVDHEQQWKLCTRGLSVVSDVAFRQKKLVIAQGLKIPAYAGKKKTFCIQHMIY